MAKFKKKWFDNHWTCDEGYTLAFTDGTRAPFLKHDDGKLVVYTAMELLAPKRVSFALFTDQVYRDRPHGPRLGDGPEWRLVLGRIQTLFKALDWRLDIM